MHRYNRLIVFSWSVLFVSLYISGCKKQGDMSGDDGFLKGIITIGPLCPVERIPPDPGCLPTAETYKAYPVAVWTSDGKDKVTQIIPELNGSFKTALPSGSYRVVLEKNQNRIGNSNLPVEVSIISKDTTILNIDIDTGIR
jgi:hypothetical protein